MLKKDPKTVKKYSKSTWKRGLSYCFIGLVVLLSMSREANAQQRWIDEGNKFLQQKNYSKAQEMFKWALRKDLNPEAQKGMLLAYRGLRNHGMAEKWGRLLMQNPAKDPQNFFLMGQVLLSRAKYDEAKSYFKRYFEARPDDPRKATFDDFSLRIAAMQADSTAAILRRSPFNSKFTDYSPRFSNEGIVFVSNRPREIGIIHKSQLHKGPMSDLFYATPLPNGFWSKAKPLEGNLNTKLNEGPVTVDTVNKRMIFTRNDPKVKKRSKIKGRIQSLQLFEAEYQNGEWIETKAFPYNSSEVAYGHPTLTQDGNTLIFASDRPGGAGGTDLWYCTRTGDTWSEPQNLGNTINTPDDEVFPFIHPNGTLYFASEGHLGLGGLDIYSSRQIDSQWSTPLNLGFPYNSNSDDFGIILSDDLETGFISSDRKGGPGKDDIYFFQSNLPQFECEPQQENVYCYTFYDRGSIETDTLPFVYQWSMGDGTVIPGLSAYHCFDGPGEYEINLNLIDSVTGFVFLHEATYNLSIKDIEQVFIDCPDTVLLGEKVTLDGRKSITPGGEVLDYYWDIGAGYVKGNATTQHRFQQTGEVVVRLGLLCREEGSTETFTRCISKTLQVVPMLNPNSPQNDPSETRNPDPRDPSLQDIQPKQADLSQIPALKELSVQDWMKQLKPHIAEIRKNSELVVRDSVFYINDKNKDTWYRLTLREGNQNGEIDEKEDDSYLIDLPEGLMIGEIELVDAQIPIDFKNIPSEGKILELTDSIRAIPAENVVTSGLPFQLENILFDFGSARLKSSSFKVIDRLAVMLRKYPDYRLEISGHTDNVGSDNFNLDLSKRRASSVLKALVIRGFPQGIDHAEVKGYGESSPLRPNDSPENRSFNRRVEFRFLPKKQ